MTVSSIEDLTKRLQQHSEATWKESGFGWWASIGKDIPGELKQLIEDVHQTMYSRLMDPNTLSSIDELEKEIGFLEQIVKVHCLTHTGNQLNDAIIKLKEEADQIEKLLSELIEKIFGKSENEAIVYFNLPKGDFEFLDNHLRRQILKTSFDEKAKKLKNLAWNPLLLQLTGCSDHNQKVLEYLSKRKDAVDRITQIEALIKRVEESQKRVPDWNALKAIYDQAHTIQGTAKRWLKGTKKVVTAYPKVAGAGAGAVVSMCAFGLPTTIFWGGIGLFLWYSCFRGIPKTT